MLKFYTYNTFNGQAIAIALGEMKLKHETIQVDLLKGNHRKPEFLKINPSARIPVIVDKLESGKTHVVSQTGAILVYLAEKTGQFLPDNPVSKAKVLQWLFFQLTDISTNVFNNFYLKSLVKPSQIESAEMLKDRGVSFYGEFNQQLQSHEFVAGHQLSIADFATYPVVHRLTKESTIQEMDHLMRWHHDMSQRPVIKSLFQN